MSEEGPSRDAAPVRNLALKARLLLLSLVLLLGAAVGYLLHARGAFERTQTLVLIADDSEGVTVGMDMTFSGFPIGRVGRIELAPDGTARIIVDVARRDAHWLRKSSIFTMENGLVGSTRIRAFSGILSDPPLEDGAERRVLRGDATAEIPRMVASVRDLVANISALTGEESALNQTLRNLQTTTERLNGPRGAIGVLLGNTQDARKISQALDRTNALLAHVDGLIAQAGGIAARTDGILARTDGIMARADTQVLGEGGLLPETRATVAQLNGLLAEARGTLKKVDAVLIEAQAIAGNTREATVDLGVLRAEVEASLRKVESLVNEVNRKWPFKRESEIRLP